MVSAPIRRLGQARIVGGMNIRLSRIAAYIPKDIRVWRAVGSVQFLRYLVARKGSILRMFIHGDVILIRKGSPDLRVAVTSLNGEFDLPAWFLSLEFEGVIVDAGGYIGTAAIAFSKLFPKSQVITVEPSLSNIEILRENVSGHSRIQVIHGALVGVQRPTVTLYNPGLREWGFTTSENHKGSEPTNRMYEVPALRVSDLGVDVAEIGLLKMDIEGGEFEILTHDRENLSSIRVIIVELHERYVDSCEKAFSDFSQNRTVVKLAGEKFVSVAAR